MNALTVSPTEQLMLTFDYAALDTETRIVVEQRTTEIKSLMRRTAQDIIDIGEKLIEVKARLGHGNFGNWLKVEFDWSYPLASKFMNVSKQFKTINFIDLNVAPSALYLLAAPSTPQEAREEALALAESGEAVTHSKAKDIVNNRKLDVHHSSESAEHYTPRHIIDAVLEVLGEIDLDPCCNPGEPNVPAAVHYRQEDNGLFQVWAGRVYLNPPYGRVIGDWVSKLTECYETGDISQALALVPARTDTNWAAKFAQYPVCYIKGRLIFIGNTDPAPFPSAVYYLGKNLLAFEEVFSKLGEVRLPSQTTLVSRPTATLTPTPKKVILPLATQEVLQYIIKQYLEANELDEAWLHNIEDDTEIARRKRAALENAVSRAGWDWVGPDLLRGCREIHSQYIPVELVKAAHLTEGTTSKLPSFECPECRADQCDYCQHPASALKIAQLEEELRWANDNYTKALNELNIEKTITAELREEVEALLRELESFRNESDAQSEELDEPIVNHIASVVKVPVAPEPPQEPEWTAVGQPIRYRLNGSPANEGFIAEVTKGGVLVTVTDKKEKTKSQHFVPIEDVLWIFPDLEIRGETTHLEKLRQLCRDKETEWLPLKSGHRYGMVDRHASILKDQNVRIFAVSRCGEFLLCALEDGGTNPKVKIEHCHVSYSLALETIEEVEF